MGGISIIKAQIWSIFQFNLTWLFLEIDTYNYTLIV